MHRHHHLEICARPIACANLGACPPKHFLAAALGPLAFPSRSLGQIVITENNPQILRLHHIIFSCVKKLKTLQDSCKKKNYSTFERQSEHQSKLTLVQSINSPIDMREILILSANPNRALYIYQQPSFWVLQQWRTQGAVVLLPPLGSSRGALPPWKIQN